ncbi:MAG: ABC transporter permease [Candidatus Nomurabacteria bacterium]|nr:MAG: ABC transporter permease [Candidatus Nomurabacteria bacterium]
MLNLIWENLRLALSAIWNSRLRSFLTMLGIVIGVFSVVTLVSIGTGVQKEFESSISDFGANIAAVISGDLGGEEGGGAITSFASLSSLSLEDVASIRTIDGASVVAPMMIVPGAVSINEDTPFQPLIMATTSDIDTLLEFNFVNGRGFSSSEMTDSARVAIVGSDFADMYFPDGALGQDFMLLDEKFTIVGTYASSSELFSGESNGVLGKVPNFNESILIPVSTAEDVLDTLNIFRIVARFDKTEQVQPGVDAIQEKLLANHKGVKDFSVLTADDILDLFDQFFGILTGAVAGIAAISLIVGGIGIMNIMLVSVTERTKEIGLRKAIGASGANILLQFLIESVILSIVGALIGIGLSIIAGIFIQAKLGLSTFLDIRIAFIGIAFSVLIGVIFGVAPAIRAARLNPIDALRYE